LKSSVDQETSSSVTSEDIRSK